ncbi:hypothetical protein [Acidocella sp. KAb 2-4]|uniref:hypothetical protein n=1 Tax=Acidocella sp. KAb 2-4 TaxID=2885158 RepID=UPI001D079776|nr:hypothetical protein [Acidocella sp. KAb 2-4]
MELGTLLSSAIMRAELKGERVMKILGALFAAFFLAGCAVPQSPTSEYIPGRIVSVADGKIMPVQIQLSTFDNPTGKMVATDPVSGEVLDGNYTAFPATTYTQASHPTLFGNETTVSTQQVSDTVPASATLVGNKGTVIVIKMQIKAGNPPVGFGEGEDNKGRKYTLQF